MSTNTTKRTLLFFKVNLKEESSMENILKYIYSLKWEEMHTTRVNDNQKIYLRWLSNKHGFIEWKISYMRMNWVPKKWKIWEKEVSDIWLKDDEWITETTHFIYAPSNNILVIEYNHFWPRIWTLEFHLNNRCSTNEKWWIDEVDFQPIFNRELIEQLKDMQEITLFKATIPKAHIVKLKNTKSKLSELFENALYFWDTWNVTIVLKWDKNKKEWVMEVNTLRNELEKIGYIAEVFSDFEIKAISKSEQKNKSYNLLQDKMKTDVTVVNLGNSRDIDSVDIFKKMRDIFNSNKEDLIELSKYE